MPIRPSPRKTPASLLSGPHTSSSPWEQVPLLTKQPQHSDKHLGLVCLPNQISYAEQKTLWVLLENALCTALLTPCT